MRKSYVFWGLVLIVIAVGTMFRWNELVGWADGHPGLASWVQAFGSIGAIWVAAWAVNKSHALQSRQKAIDEFDEKTRSFEVVFQLVGGAAQAAGKIFKLENESGPATPEELLVMTIELDAFADALRRLDPSHLDRFEFTEAALVAEMTLRRLRDAVERVQAEEFSNLLEPHYLRNVANIAHRDLADRAKKLGKITEDRGLRKGSDIRPN